MSVRVRMFAALREAAGEGETAVGPGPLSQLLDELRTRYGEPFGVRLAVCGVLVNGCSVSPTAQVEVPDGAEVALLPPVSGGAVATSPPARKAALR
jgi:sulfur-carrier protein